MKQKVAGHGHNNNTVRPHYLQSNT